MSGAQALAPGRIERRALRPALLLVTDGLATDPPGGFEAGLSALMSQPAGKAALRLAIAIGRDAQSAALDRFIADPNVPVLVANSTEDIADRLVAAGITAVLNFAPSVVTVPEGASLRKVDLASELQILSFYQQRQQGDDAAAPTA